MSERDDDNQPVTSFLGEIGLGLLDVCTFGNNADLIYKIVKKKIYIKKE